MSVFLLCTFVGDSGFFAFLFKLYNRFVDIHKIICWNVAKSVDQVGKNWYILIVSSYPWTWIFSIFGRCLLWLLSLEFCSCLLIALLHNLLDLYLSILYFHANIIDAVFLISNSHYPLLLCKKTVDFCVLKLCLATLLLITTYFSSRRF